MEHKKQSGKVMVVVPVNQMELYRRKLAAAGIRGAILVDKLAVGRSGPTSLDNLVKRNEPVSVVITTVRDDSDIKALKMSGRATKIGVPEANLDTDNFMGLFMRGELSGVSVDVFGDGTQPDLVKRAVEKAKARVVIDRRVVELSKTRRNKV